MKKGTFTAKNNYDTISGEYSLLAIFKLSSFIIFFKICSLYLCVSVLSQVQLSVTHGLPFLQALIHGILPARMLELGCHSPAPRSFSDRGQAASCISSILLTSHISCIYGVSWIPGSPASLISCISDISRVSSSPASRCLLDLSISSIACLSPRRLHLPPPASPGSPASPACLLPPAQYQQSFYHSLQAI